MGKDRDARRKAEKEAKKAKKKASKAGSTAAMASNITKPKPEGAKKKKGVPVMSAEAAKKFKQGF